MIQVFYALAEIHLLHYNVFLKLFLKVSTETQKTMILQTFVQRKKLFRGNSKLKEKLSVKLFPTCKMVQFLLSMVEKESHIQDMSTFSRIEYIGGKINILLSKENQTRLKYKEVFCYLQLHRLLWDEKRLYSSNIN